MRKVEVCEYLGKSKRTVETFISRGRLPATYYNGPNGKTASFDAAAVKALKRELDTPMYRAVPAPAPIAMSPAASAPVYTQGGEAGESTALAIRSDSKQALSRMDAMLELLTAFRAQAPPSIGKWITLEEAAERSGLPRTYLLAQARQGASYAINVGSEERKSWRFSAEGLGYSSRR